ncbi:peptidoglycan editing factor PgeF [Nanchangia anserum]|uniref:Purine nucleoside phosphorylase n=1 Tax=Nanchangia anserum TaxID=2692125 RepID=A0A8I0GDP3_9ACTO|nr:peptidoglycan editing factor PgeF [Nanchangia anserum]
MFAIGGAQAVFTNRKGGVSLPPYDTLNLGFHVGDDDAAVARNRRIVARAIERDVVWMNQVHSARVEVVRPGHTHVTPTCDALVCDAEEFRRLGLNVPALAVMVADCVPVLIASASGRYVAAIHAGRAGIVRRVIAETARVLKRAGAGGDTLHAAIGPSICAHCYEVGEDMRAHVTQSLPEAWATTRLGTPALDLRGAAQAQLREEGIAVSFISKRCTYESGELYSHRRYHPTGRFAGLIMS